VAASYADNEIWHVMIADDMKRMNVDQLDDAFRLSLVDASTMVWKAGMKTWQSLGAVAGIDDEPEDSITRMVVSAPPPPPRPLARPAPKPPSPRSLAPASPAHNPFLATPAPVFQQAFAAPAPVLMPKPLVAAPRRAALDSDIDFRRKSRGVRWGRWMVALLLVTGGVLAAHRQNLLREGARRLGVEGKYLYGEHRVTDYVSAKAPYAVKNALTKLALLPGPNAIAAAPPVVVAKVEPTPVAVTPKPVEAKPAEDASVKTVSLDALPVLTAEEPSKPAPVAPAHAPVHAAVAPKAKPAVAKPEKAVKVARSEPKPEPKPKAAPPAPVTNDNPLKAAIRSAIAADAAKK
jgi:hypothetical protein